ncbi:MAG: UDP-N-acetylmuramoyl-tripeptide--D-alanyl-D-alanine ligase [Actinobacteria bacterium]|nr:UDP-N-acetylmuramoyl-tripeptide--D-alanyl-D-alanine ligase [Actinomycetota bacterium]
MKTGKRICLESILKHTDVKILSPEIIEHRENIFIETLSTDTRTIEKGDFFVPVRGDNFDGHDFIPEALNKGCRGFVFEKENEKKIENYLKKYSKEKTRKLLLLKSSSNISFLLDLCAGYIRDFTVKTIGITGSAGKTTTKEFIASIMAQDFKIALTQKNYNTELGLSKAVLEIDGQTQFFIAEIGMRAKGQVKKLSGIINVSTGAITSVGKAHLEFFNDVSQIALAKAEIADIISSNNGVLFLNSDDKWTQFIIKHFWDKKLEVNIKKFGRSSENDFSFIEKSADSYGRYVFDLYKGSKKISEIKMPVPGFHNIYNACCAAAISFYLGASAKSIAKGIEATVPEGSRMRVFSKEGIIIIDDCYNASPDSMKCAIDTLKMVAGKKKARSVALLADMLELGPDSKKLHFEIGRYLANNDINIIISYGKLAENICLGYEQALSEDKRKTGKKNIYHFNDMKKLCGQICKILKKEDVVLIKGSRANSLENVIEYI